MTSHYLNLVLFDIDGTLLLSGPMIRGLFSRAFEAATGASVDLDGIGFAGRTDRGIFRAAWERRGCAGEFEAAFGRFSAQFEAEMRRSYPGADGPYLLPGVIILLEALAARGVPLVVGTGNLRATGRIKLARFGLDRFFPVGAFGNDHDERVAVFREALQTGRTHYGEAIGVGAPWVVGDTVADVAAARQVGARMMAVATGPEPEAGLRAAGAEVVLPDLAGTAAIVARLAARGDAS